MKRNYTMFDNCNTAIDFWQKSQLDLFDYVLLLPPQDECLKEIMVELFNFKLGNRRGIMIEGELAQALIELYSLYAFTDKVIIGSFSEPTGRKLHNLLNVDMSITKGLINDVILGDL